MRLDINKLKTVPLIDKSLELCVYGEVPSDITEWIQYHKFETYIVGGKYTNIKISNNVKLSSIFKLIDKFKYMDGFSPNTSKHLHIGHFSNLVLAKSFKSLNICDETISLFGDTLIGEIDNSEGYEIIIKLLELFDYIPDKQLFASKQVLNNDSLLEDGTSEYLDTKIFNISDTEKIVGVKSNGNTSYFYQDVCLAEYLNDSTIYLTGKEQTNHFNSLQKLFPHIKHIGLGLVKLNSGKMSSRFGNVILIKDFLLQLSEQFNNDSYLIYNVFAGHILKSNPDVDKNINLDMISNPKNSAGLYISYTMARLHSAGCEAIGVLEFKDNKLEYAYLKSQINLKPNILFEQVVKLCEHINDLYSKHIIKNNSDNKIMFEYLYSDLLLGVKKLGMFKIEKV